MRFAQRRGGYKSCQTAEAGKVNYADKHFALLISLPPPPICAYVAPLARPPPYQSRRSKVRTEMARLDKTPFDALRFAKKTG